jgi:hypothetical protein
MRAARWAGVVFLAAAFAAACHRPVEVRGMYISRDSLGTFFPCDDPKIAVTIQDSALAARYHAAAIAHEPVFVRLRGVRGHAGSIYGGERSFYVQQILEVRPRAAGECPGVAQSIAPALP